jgi:hypothetical protein
MFGRATGGEVYPGAILPAAIAGTARRHEVAGVIAAAGAAGEQMVKRYVLRRLVAQRAPTVGTMKLVAQVDRQALLFPDPAAFRLKLAALVPVAHTYILRYSAQ